MYVLALSSKHPEAIMQMINLYVIIKLKTNVPRAVYLINIRLHDICI